MFVTNPNLRAQDKKIKSFIEHKPVQPKPKTDYKPLVESKSKKIVNGLSNRVFLVPGKMVAVWFEHIPENLPYLKGCGYRFMKPINNCYHDYQFELYKIVFPENHKKGYKGSLNTSSFMYEYANFGIIGLIISALILAYIISFIEVYFSDNRKLRFSINAFYILMLSSSAISTLLFSGGWILMIILYVIFRKTFSK